VLKWMIVLLGAVAAAMLTSERRREELLERVKDLSDTLVNDALRVTSQFGGELTGERREEQDAFRRIRLRDLR
jgi:hypothetical protein